MLRNTNITRIIVVFLSVLMISTTRAHMKTDPDPIPGHGNYVVIGAFSFIRNAERFTTFAREQKSFDAQFAINPLRNLYYVYMFKSDDRKEAVDVVLKVRDENPDLWDAWVFTGSLGALDESGLVSPSLSESSEEYTEEENAEWERTIAQYQANTDASEGDASEPNTLTSLRDSSEIATVDVKEISKPVAQNIEPKEGHYYLYFNTINKKTMKEVKGRVRMIDPKRHKELELAESHQIVEVKDPNNGSKTLSAATQIFGFREVKHTFSLENPVNDSTSAYIETIGDSIILDFELERFKKGDILVMYNVYFFKDAAVMKPESKYELMSLLDMLEENDKLKVRIHGHTNGNAKGKIIHLDEEKNFFSLGADQEEDFGSAKKLSTFRAETIQDWLIAQGISADRMSIKGWGGKKMIYDKHDTQAHKNVRVEIEIVED